MFARAFAVIREAIAQRAFPGAALAVTHRGSLVASQGFGAFNYDQDATRVRAGTVFDLASLTKVIVTTTAAMLLQERGQMDVDAPLAGYLPDFVSLAPREQQAARAAVTIRTLLAHSSGLPAYEKLFQFAPSREELLRRALSTPLVAAPNSLAEYSDIGFILLGEVLLRQANQPLDVFARQEIFAPWG